MGNNVICVDVDEKKIDNLKKGIVPIYEPGLETMVVENLRLGTLPFSTSMADALDNSEICCIAVGTPMERTAMPICNMSCGRAGHRQDICSIIWLWLTSPLSL